MKIKILLLLSLLLFFGVKPSYASQKTLWPVQAIDTMKYSRDMAREKLNVTSFDQTIDTQAKIISEIGATHIAVSTPFDSEFLPFLRRWVKAARKYNLNVWFRGNWSGWEGWFDYPKITREEHIQKTNDFILNNPDLFQDGDIFSSCPECENGGPGDPRKTGDTSGFRQFLISEYKSTGKAFNQINKKVQSNYFSANGDVAKLIMDKNTTKALDNYVTVDHYVGSADKFANDIRNLNEASAGKIVLGEFGAPVPDLNGKMDEAHQANFVRQLLTAMYLNKNVVGLNYWTLSGGTTQLLNNDGSPRMVVKTLEDFYKPAQVSGTVVNNSGGVIANAKISYESDKLQTYSDADGKFTVIVPVNTIITLKAGKESYETASQTLTIDKSGPYSVSIPLIPQNKNIFYSLKQFFLNLEKFFSL